MTGDVCALLARVFDPDAQQHASPELTAAVSVLVDSVSRAVALAMGEQQRLAQADIEAVAACRLADGGEALFGLVAAGMREARALAELVSRVAVKAKDAGQFTFGELQDFKGGLQQMIGLPSGLDEAQWIRSMEAEHCGVEGGASATWGASERAWRTGNYSLLTTPRAEWEWVRRSVWDGEVRAWAPGGYEQRGDAGFVEDERLRRKAVSAEELHAQAPRLIHAMLVRLGEERGTPLELTEEAVGAMYRSTGVNLAEVIALRLYTGAPVRACSSSRYNPVLCEMLPWLMIDYHARRAHRPDVRVHQHGAARARQAGAVGRALPCAEG